MGMFGSTVKKSLIEQSKDAIQSFTTIIEQLTSLNDTIQADKEVKSAKIEILEHEVQELDTQKVQNANIISKITKIIE